MIKTIKIIENLKLYRSNRTAKRNLQIANVRQPYRIPRIQQKGYETCAVYHVFNPPIRKNTCPVLRGRAKN